MKLYHHKTDGGAEYLCSSNIEGTTEGSFNSRYIVRIDGDITQDAKLRIDRESSMTTSEKLHWLVSLAMALYFAIRILVAILT